MRKLIRTTAVALALTGALALLPTKAGAIGYEDSLDDCAYPESFDVFIMRPVSFMGLLFGSVTLGVTAPIWAAFDLRDAGTITHNLVVEPAQFTFGRRIGQCGASADE
ncbi:MAG TPA: hypothetical protein VMR50_01560 [Myxococcota bacterium]|nr:hypothetical protein [Myxococcota bacterium]